MTWALGALVAAVLAAVAVDAAAEWRDRRRDRACTRWDRCPECEDQP